MARIRLVCHTMLSQSSSRSRIERARFRRFQHEKITHPTASRGFLCSKDGVLERGVRSARLDASCRAVGRQKRNDKSRKRYLIINILSLLTPAPRHQKWQSSATHPHVPARGTYPDNSAVLTLSRGYEPCLSFYRYRPPLPLPWLSRAITPPTPSSLRSASTTHRAALCTGSLRYCIRCASVAAVFWRIKY